MEPDRTVPESVWHLDVNGERYAEGSALPGALAELVVGRLVADGVLRRGEGPRDLEESRTPAGTPLVSVRVNPAALERARAESRHRRAHGCGLRHFVDCAPIAGVERRLAVPDEAAAGAMLRTLFSSIRRPGGGVHGFGLWDGRRLVHALEEVARHAGFDRASGWVVLNDVPAAELGLVSTARISAEMAVKAARAGFAWVVTRSVATSLAAEIAAAAGLPLVGRAASRDPARYEPAPPPAGST